MDNDGKLGCDEFVLAMFLCDQVLSLFLGFTYLFLLKILFITLLYIIFLHNEIITF